MGFSPVTFRTDVGGMENPQKTESSQTTRVVSLHQSVHLSMSVMPFFFCPGFASGIFRLLYGDFVNCIFSLWAKFRFW